MVIVRDFRSNFLGYFHFIFVLILNFVFARSQRTIVVVVIVVVVVVVDIVVLPFSRKSPITCGWYQNVLVSCSFDLAQNATRCWN